MGFFGGLGKVLSGKPVFEPGDQSSQSGGGQPAGRAEDNQAAAPAVLPQDKAVPVVRFGRIENRINGQNLEVYADVRNDSDVPVFIDLVKLCGARRQLDVQLAAGQERQLLIYSGGLFVQQPADYAEVQYRTAQDGDYFIDYHEIRCEQDGVEGYRITELLQRGPVKDI